MLSCAAAEPGAILLNGNKIALGINSGENPDAIAKAAATTVPGTVDFQDVLSNSSNAETNGHPLRRFVKGELNASRTRWNAIVSLTRLRRQYFGVARSRRAHDLAQVLQHFVRSLCFVSVESVANNCPTQLP